MTTTLIESPSGLEVARWGSHLCPPKMGGTITTMTTAHRTGTIKVPGRPDGLAAVSITGRPSVHVIYREVWEDQVDNHGQPCEFCQLEDRTIECNVYVPTRNGSTDCLNACRCCAPVVVMDHADLDPSRDSVIEYAKEK